MFWPDSGERGGVNERILLFATATGIRTFLSLITSTAAQRRLAPSKSCRFSARHNSLDRRKTNIPATIHQEKRRQYANRCPEHHVV